jgi:phosphonate transport system substrate-binding protein
MSAFFRKAAFAAVALASGVALAQAETPAEINFGIISTETSSNLKKIWEPYLEAMSRGTGLKIKGFYASDYAGVIEAMRFNKVHLAWHGNKSAMEAVNRSNGEIFVQSVDAEGNPGYWSHIIVHKDSPLKTLDDVLKCDKSIEFGNGDPNSTSGFLVPMSYIFAERNIDPKQCFKTVRNGSHEANALAVANKQVTAATGNNENLRRLQLTAPDSYKNIKVVWTSPLIPSDPLVWRKDLAADVKAKLVVWTLNYGRVGTPEEIAKAKKVLGDLNWAPFNPSTDHQLLPIRRLEVNKDLLKIQADDKLPAADKAVRIGKLKAEIAKIEADEKAAQNDPQQKRIAAFIAADKAGNQDALKKMIAEFRAAFAGTN